MSSEIGPTTRADCPTTEVGGAPRTLFGAVELIGARQANGGLAICMQARRA
jgi:hypothetical protein